MQTLIERSMCQCFKRPAQPGPPQGVKSDSLLAETMQD